MRWRSKAGGAIAEKPASAASKVMLSLNALQIAVQAWFASEKTFGAGQQQSPAESFAKVLFLGGYLYLCIIVLGSNLLCYR